MHIELKINFKILDEGKADNGKHALINRASII
jgi:hypothetical protein